MENIKLHDWQMPFVDIFKNFKTFQSSIDAIKGSVTPLHDTTIGRKTLNIQGSVISSNFIIIPDPNRDKSLQLVGRYVFMVNKMYIELMSMEEKHFAIHFEFKIHDRQPSVKLTLNNIQKEVCIVGGNTIKIPFPKQLANRWTIMCIDIQHCLQNFGLFSKGAVANFNGCHTLKQIQVCANLAIRGIYTSPNIYNWVTLPRQMSFKMDKGSKMQTYNFIYFPSNNSPTQMVKKIKQEKIFECPEEQSQISSSVRASTIKQKSSPKSEKPLNPLLPDPILQLAYSLSYCPMQNTNLAVVQSEIVYSSGSIIIKANYQTGEQTFIQGHTQHICSFDCQKNIIVTAQSGKKGISRIWIDKKCICSFQGPYQKVQQIKLSKKGLLAIIGIDNLNRQVIIIFQITNIKKLKKPQFVAKQISDFHISMIKFSPADQDRLVSCGKQNIRFWRIKKNHLPGAPVILNQHARNSFFTVLDFQLAQNDPKAALQGQIVKNVFVGTKTGLLFQVNYNTQQLLQVYPLHQGSICSLAVGGGRCVTGGQDQLLKVWPMDFQDFILEAEHQGAICSLARSQDGQQFACGTISGGMGILDIKNHNYKILLRSHTQSIKQMRAQPQSNMIYSLSEDLTIRLWDIQKHEQTYEFTYPKEDVCTKIAPNPCVMFFAAGFESGIFRIFDVQKICIIHQLKYHQNSITAIQFSPDGKLLIVADKNSFYCVYDALRGYQPIKTLERQMKSQYQSIAFPSDSGIFAIIGDSGSHVNIYQCKSLSISVRIFCANSTINFLRFSPINHLFLITSNCTIKIYSLTLRNPQLLHQQGPMHRGRINDIDFSPGCSYIATVGSDSILKVWDYDMQKSHQIFVGHVQECTSVIWKQGLVFTSGVQQGIYQWRFLGTEDNLNLQRIQRYDFRVEQMQKQKEGLSQQMEQFEQENAQFKIQMKEEDEQKGWTISQKMKKRIQCSGKEITAASKFVPVKIMCEFEQLIWQYKKSKKRQIKQKYFYSKSNTRKKYNLPLKHLFIQQLEQPKKYIHTKLDLLKENLLNFKLDMLIGYDHNSHDNIAWNYLFGWFAYSLDNLLIIQSLNKDRQQKIIPLPEPISVIILSKDMKKIIVGSATSPFVKKSFEFSSSLPESNISQQKSQIDDAVVANIYILNTQFEIQKKLPFHPKGVQSLCLSDNNKYLISIGNFKECTVCIWELPSFKIKTSSYILDKINDVRCLQNPGQGRLLQFVTVGRDQIHLWAFTKQQTLQYCDIFVEKDQEGNLKQLTTCDYVFYDQDIYLLVGTSEGQILLIEYATCKTVYKKVPCASEIVTIRTNNAIKRAILASADGNLYYWNYNNILSQSLMPSFYKLALHYPINSFTLDPLFTQGLAGTFNGIFYFNINEQYSSLLVGAANSNPVLLKIINENYFITSHQDGKFKLWNTATGQQIKTYKWKGICTDCIFDQSNNKLMCFFQNNNQIKFVNLKKFTRQEIYVKQEGVKADKKAQDYPIKAFNSLMGGVMTKWVVMKKGEIFTVENIVQNKTKLARWNKIFQVPDLCQFVPYNQKSIFIASNYKGQIGTYLVDISDVDKVLKFNQTFNFTIIDRFYMIDASNLSQLVSIKVCPSKSVPQTYFACNNLEQYCIMRNYMKRMTLQKFSLSSIPISIQMYQGKKQSDVIIGLIDGSMQIINSFQFQIRYKLENILNGGITHLITNRSKNLIIISNMNGTAIYKF